MSFYSAAGDGLRLRLKVKPQARRDAIDGFAPPLDDSEKEIFGPIFFARTASWRYHQQGLAAKLVG